MQKRFSVVRRNLMNQKDYTPYCGEQFCTKSPRSFFNGEQFECHSCGWTSEYDRDFIQLYIRKQKELSNET